MLSTASSHALAWLPLVPSGPLPTLDLPPWQLSGRVYGAMVNHAPLLAALGDAVNQAPYKAAPRAPVLQVKPRNCLAGNGAQVTLPAGVKALDVGASLALVIGRTASRVSRIDALAHLAGVTLAADLSVPHLSHYRPALRERAGDGFCPLGPRVVPLSAIDDVDALPIEVAIDGRVVQQTSTADRVRQVAQLLADVSAFMTLQPGDLLMLGPAADAPQAGAGSQVAISAAGIGTLSFTVHAARGKGALQ